jgi:MFS family permease
VCLVGLSCLQPPIWHLYALYALAGLTTAATTSVGYSRVVANWFDRERGLALGLASSGAGVGAFLTPLGAQFLIDRANWRIAYLGLAAACLLVAAPVVWLFLRTSPPEAGLPVPRTEQRDLQGGMTAREALGTGTFWQLAFIFFCVAASVSGASAHLVPLLTDAGVSARSAALAASVFGAAMIVGRIGNGYLVDRFAGLPVAASLFAGAAFGVVLLWSGLAVKMAFLAATLLGLAAGAEADLMPFLISRYFGLRSMGELYGYIFGVFTIGNAVGRYLLAAGFDAWGSYKIPLAFAALALTFSIGGTLLLGDYRQQELRFKAVEGH